MHELIFVYLYIITTKSLLIFHIFRRQYPDNMLNVDIQLKYV